MKANKILIPDHEPSRDNLTAMERAILLAGLYISLAILVWNAVDAVSFHSSTDGAG